MDKKSKYSAEFYLLNKQSNRVTRYRYKYQNLWHIIPYDKNTHKVITIFKDKKQDILQYAEIIDEPKKQSYILTCSKSLVEYIKQIKNKIRLK